MCISCRVHWYLPMHDSRSPTELVYETLTIPYHKGPLQSLQYNYSYLWWVNGPLIVHIVSFWGGGGY